MKKLIIEKIPRIVKNRKKLEEDLGVKIEIKDGEISIEGSPVEEYVAEKVVDALNFGFPFAVAMSVKDDDVVFETIRIKDYTKKRNLGGVRARLIGSGGKTLRALAELTKCNFEIKGNEVGIIGDAEGIKPAQQAVILLIQGSKTANVYSYLEKHHPKPIFDFGIKEEKKEE